LAARRKEIEDQPVPSGASAMAVSLIRLHALTGDATHLDRADSVIRNLTTVADRAPNAVGRVLLAIGIRSRGVKEVAIAGEGRDEMVAAFRSGLRRDAVIAAAAKPSNSLLPLLLGREPDHGPATAYVCRNFTCSLPVTSPQALLDQLNA
ncbi:MAG: thioredoxin domain-containing protein, partial [Solirubrobacterales bacterium]|nr:thioredoxin domain-containing protein [Solirubrobacterales bacterium]